MNWEIRLALALIMLLILLSLQACGQVPVLEKIENQQQMEAVVEDQSTTPPNFDSIANALGCIFAPNSCDNSQ